MLDRILDDLSAWIAANPKRAFFNPPADAADIADIEISAGLTLPDSYRQFLRRFNGGFINTSELSPGNELWSEKAARHNSNALLGSADILLPLEQMRQMNDSGKVERFPFLQIAGDKLLVFGPGDDAADRPVQDARSRRTVFPDFQSLLRAYVDRDGRIMTIADV